MHNSINPRSAVAILLIALAWGDVTRVAHGQTTEEPKQCQPDKINQLLKEIMACQGSKPPAPPSGPKGLFPFPAGQPRPLPRGFPGSRPGFIDDSDFFNRAGPTFFTGGSSSPSGQSGIGVLVSRPVPADVRPVVGEGSPTDTQFFIAGPRTRPNDFPTFGSGGFPFGPPRREPPQTPQEKPSGGSQVPELTPGSFFPSLFGRSPELDIDQRFGGLPSPSFGNPFEGPTLTFDIPPSGEAPLGIDFNEIIRLLKELQEKEEGKGEEESNNDEKQGPGMNPDLDVNTTEGIIDIDTTMNPTTEESVTESTPTPTTTMPTENPK